MRTIVPFVLSLAIAGSAAAQPGVPPIELIEKKIAAGRDTIQDHITLMNLYTGARNIEKRREQILWLIAHNPENPQFRTLTSNIGADSFLPDAEGLAQASELWRAVIARPDVPAAALTNAAWFFRFTDLDFAWSIVKSAEESHRDDLEMKRIRGMLDALTMLHSDTAVAARARAEIDWSNYALLLIGAADTLTQPPFNPNSRGLTMDDRFDIAEKWLLRAREVAPEDRDGKVALSRIYGMQAGQVADARWKMELYRRANTLAPNAFTLQQLAFAEYEAGEDDAALKTVERLLENKPVTPNVPHIAHTVRGLVALDRKHVDEAKAELLESAKMTMNIEPDRTLAQALIDAGERDIVVQFLEACRTFWKNDRGALDYYIRMVKSPGSHDITTRYFAGQGVRGRPAPKLPIDDYAGKPVAVQFRNAACKDCASEFASLDKVASRRGIKDAWIDVAGNEAIVRQMEIQSFPTVVLINAEGRVVDFLPGHIDENLIDNRMAAFTSTGRTLTAPVPIGPFAWKPVPGAESYVVQWDQRDAKGWLSDRDEHLVRVIPTHETSVVLDPTLGEATSSAIRWRVFAVSQTGPGPMSQWNEIAQERP